jgi:ribosome maturation factor RimP
MEFSVRASALRPVIEPVLQAHGLELDDLALVRAGNREIVKVTVDGDGPAGRGPDLDSIAAAARAVSAALDDSPLTGERPYVLEVGSPGVSRPLLKPVQWRRNLGRVVKVRLLAGETVLGRIQSAGWDRVVVAMEADAVELNYGDIAQAIVQAELTNPESDRESNPR